jgi:hypothetical protein
MLAKPIFLAIVAACGIQSNSVVTPDEPVKRTPDEVQEDQHFCCQSVDPKTWTGEGCGAISKENINSCDKVLYCPGKWAKDDGKVTCD